jgi:ribosomal protein S6
MNEINEKNDNLIYEVGFHLLPTIDESDVPNQSSNIKSIIEENGGVILSEEMPKMMILAYDISKAVNSKKQKFNKAYFGWVKFEVAPGKVTDIKNKIENNQNVLRFLIIKTVRESTIHTPKIPMFKKDPGASSGQERGEEHAEKPKVSEAEIDKSIDELVINQTL